MATVRIVLHDVPQNGIASNRDHRLGNVIRHIPNSCSVATAENNYFHYQKSPLCCAVRINSRV